MSNLERAKKAKIFLFELVSKSLYKQSSQISKNELTHLSNSVEIVCQLRQINRPVVNVCAGFQGMT